MKINHIENTLNYNYESWETMKDLLERASETHNPKLLKDLSKACEDKMKYINRILEDPNKYGLDKCEIDDKEGFFGF